MSKAIKQIRLTPRSVFNDPLTRVAMDLAYEGFTHDTIQRSVKKLTIGQVSYRLGRLGVSTTYVRRGIGEEASKRLNAVLEHHGLPARRFRRKAG